LIPSPETIKLHGSNPESVPPRRGFGDYQADGFNWITPVGGEFYPDYLTSATATFEGPIKRFGELIRQAGTSDQLLRLIGEEPNPPRVQLCRVFRKYVCPVVSVELLKQRKKVDSICRLWGHMFRPIDDVRRAWASRPDADEALSAVLWEYNDRGQKGYDLAAAFFEYFRAHFDDHYSLEGPAGAGPDIKLDRVLKDYPHERPVDFLVRRRSDSAVRVVGFERYDSDRGGAQEDDRTGGYRTAVDEVLRYSDSKRLGLKVLFINDGPGLLLGSMWRDYAEIENRHPGRVLVSTLKMLPERLTRDWIEDSA
jgi:hypothetical protein